MKKFKAGEEITFCYTSQTVLHTKRQERRQLIYNERFFACYCNFCQKDAENEKDFELYEMFSRTEKMKKKCQIAKDPFSASFNR